MTDREAMKLALESLEYDTEPDAKYGINVAIEALRDRLAAPEQTHPGYVIGSHWLETAYSRICAGEAEADVLRDYPPFAALAAEVERLTAEIARLREALNTYGQHHNNCAVVLGGYQCTCGFNQQEPPR